MDAWRDRINIPAGLKTRPTYRPLKTRHVRTSKTRPTYRPRRPALRTGQGATKSVRRPGL